MIRPLAGCLVLVAPRPDTTIISKKPGHRAQRIVRPQAGKRHAGPKIVSDADKLKVARSGHTTRTHDICGKLDVAAVSFGQSSRKRSRSVKDKHHANAKVILTT